jgi:hypothetical protein
MFLQKIPHVAFVDTVPLPQTHNECHVSFEWLLIEETCTTITITISYLLSLR